MFQNTKYSCIRLSYEKMLQRIGCFYTNLKAYDQCFNYLKDISDLRPLWGLGVFIISVKIFFKKSMFFSVPQLHFF